MSNITRHTGRDAGQIGRTADLHGFAARRVWGMDAPNASSHRDVKLQTYARVCHCLCALTGQLAIGKLPSMALDTGIPAGMTAFRFIG